MKSFFFVLMLITFVNCNKTNDVIQYKGEVIKGTTDCNTPMGFIYLINYTKINNTIDSFYTASLPAEFKIPGTKILFKIRNIIPDDEVMVCKAYISIPIQKSIYDVKPNN